MVTAEYKRKHFLAKRKGDVMFKFFKGKEKGNVLYAPWQRKSSSFDRGSRSNFF